MYVYLAEAGVESNVGVCLISAQRTHCQVLTTTRDGNDRY